MFTFGKGRSEGNKGMKTLVSFIYLSNLHAHEPHLMVTSLESVVIQVDGAFGRLRKIEWVY